MTSLDAPTPAPPGRPQDRAAPLVFPLEGIDLDARLQDRDEIARWNPHRGEMALLDAVVWHTDDCIRAVGYKRVRNDEFWVSGHFPGRPLMPGVLLVEAGAQLANLMFLKWLARTEGHPKTPVKLDKVAGFTRIEDTVFREGVRPGDDLYLLSLGEKVSKRRFVSKVQGVVGDRIAFESRMTGMLL